MNSETVASAKKVVKPTQKRGVYMDFAAKGKKPAPRQATLRRRPEGPTVLRPDARAAQANARIAQKKAQLEAQQRAARLAKAGVPGRAPGLERVTRAAKPTRPTAQVKPTVQPRRVAQARPVVQARSEAQARPVAREKFVARPAANPEPQRPLSQGRVVKPRGAVVQYTEATVADARTGRLVEQESYEEIDFGVIEDYQSPDKPITEEAAPEAAPEVVKMPEKGSNWPFLKSVQVEKRPLSGRVAPAKKSPAPQPTTVTPAASSIALNSGVAKKGSKLPMVGLVLLTIILGVAVGAAVYFAIFQSGGPEDI